MSVPICPLPGVPFSTRNVTDDDITAPEAVATLYPTEAALARLVLTVCSDEAVAAHKHERESCHSILCFDCGHVYDAAEPIIEGRYTFSTFFGAMRRKVTYCATCRDPDNLWNHEMWVCETCNRAVYLFYRRRKRAFCSVACSQKYYNKLQKQHRLQDRHKTCQQCDKDFVAPRRDTKFCTAACKQKAYRSRGVR